MLLPRKGVTRSVKEAKIEAIQPGLALPGYKCEHCLSLFLGQRRLIEQEVSPTEFLGGGLRAHRVEDLAHISAEGQGRLRDALEEFEELGVTVFEAQHLKIDCDDEGLAHLGRAQVGVREKRRDCLVKGLQISACT